MSGTMMHHQLTINSLIDHAARYHHATEVVSVETTGGVDRSNWGNVARNARKLASALEKLGIEFGARVATLAWNNRRHLEIYFGVAGGGRVTHTINPRLFPEQITYIVNHAEDKVVMFDASFLPLVAAVRNHFETVDHFILLGPRDDKAADTIPGLLFYDDFIETGEDDYQWRDIDETQPSSLCYTSGTTGNPKGVQYSHRSTVLHSIAGNQPDGLAISACDSVMPVVPMFHVNAWGVPYIAAAVGARIVLPGPALDGESLARLIDAEGVTLSLGVPTIWMGLLDGLAKTGATAKSMTRTVVGGSALPPSMIPEFRDNYGVELIHAWGMTETSPLGTLNQLLQKHGSLTDEEQAKLRLGQGRPPWGVELRIVDENGTPLPSDGETQGELHIRGHWIAGSYLKHPEPTLTDDGWFDTGDIASIDDDGYMVIRDRSKDIIKSGGEWISTVELENIAISHPEISNAAVIAARHEKWGERPIVIAVKSRGAEVTEKDVLQYYRGHVVKWQIPDHVIFVQDLPLGATGKVLKMKLREEFGEVLIGTN